MSQLRAPPAALPTPARPAAASPASRVRSPAARTTLRIGRPDDALELEADRAADAVLRGQTLGVGAAASGGLQRKCAGCEDEVEHLQRVAEPSAQANADLPAVAERLAMRRGSGTPLSSEQRRYFEPRFGFDFNAVRLHRDPEAGSLARSLGAQAFTLGRDVYFAPGKYAPGSSAGRHLLAHELAHVVQQSPRSLERSPLLPSAAPAIVQRLSADDVVSGARGALDTVVSAPGRLASALLEAGSDVASFGYEQLLALIERYAPGFLAFLREGPVAYLKSRLGAALDSILENLLGRVRREGVVESLRAVLGETFSGAATIAADLRAGSCESLFAAVSTIMDFADVTLGPLVREVGGFFSQAGSALRDVWSHFGQPIVDVVSRVGGAFWTGLVRDANALWSATAPIRAAAADLWQRFQREFDLRWDQGVSGTEWLMAKAREAWEALKVELGPALIPLEILVGGILLATPLGPVVAIAGAYQGISAAVGWIRANWGDIREFFVAARETLHTQVLPVIMSGVGALSGAIQTGTQWLAQQFESIAGTVQQLASALGLTPLLNAFAALVARVAREVQALASWASVELAALADHVRATLTELHQTLRPLYGLVAALVMFPVNPFMLPVVLAGWFWRLTPDCIKAPVIDWVIELMTSAVQALPAFASFGEWWPQAREQVLATLARVAGLPMAERIAATNRIAKMMTLEDVEWIGNLVQAAIQAPAMFPDQVLEEVSGLDLNSPLPFERTELATSGFTSGGGASALVGSPLGVLAQDSLSEADVGVDAVGRLDLSRELLASAGLSSDGEVGFGDRGPGYATIEAMRADAAIMSASGGLSPEPAVLPGSTSLTPPATAGLSQEEANEARLQAMMDEPDTGGCPGREEAREPAAAPEAIPDALKFGPLTRSQRARYQLNQMRRGISKWFDCNKAWLIPGIILAVIALIGAEIITEGAITAALPAIMQVLTAVLLGVAAVRSSYYLAEYIARAAPGDVAGGARSLARSVAVVAVEAAFALLFNSGAVIKSLRRGVVAAGREAVAAARAFGRATVEATETLGRVVARGARTGLRNITRIPGAILREGRLIMEGVGEGIGRGLRSLDDLARRLWQRLRFRRFKLRRSGRSVQLWGEINPWILLANGEIEWVDELIEGGTAGERAAGRVGDRLVEGLLVHGPQTRPNYRNIADVFFDEAVSQANVIHHAIEQQVRRRFPGLFSLAEIHGGNNLRVILRGAFNSEVHLSKVRILWNAFYPELEAARSVAGFTDDMARTALFRFRDSVDDYIRHMSDFMASNPGTLAATARNDQEAVRALLQAESEAFLRNGFIARAVEQALPVVP